MKKISRRFFLKQTAALAALMSASACSNDMPVESSGTPLTTDAGTVSFYPPRLTGLRGDHDGAQTAAHHIALEDKQYVQPDQATETYDLVIVGAGLSGLTSAFYYHQAKPDAKILVVDNHDDFGGHAKRNEFVVSNRKLITYGGSESLDAPKNTFSPVATQFLKDLGIDYTKFEQYYDQALYSEGWKLNSGVFLNAETFGKAAFISGELEVENEANVELINQFPFSDEDKQLLIELYNHPKDYLHGKSAAKREDFAENTSYYDFLKNIVQATPMVMKFLQNISSEYWGHAIDCISVMEALENGYPGVQNLGLTYEEEEEEPYIYHFPDGNASVARLLVRRLIPSIASGSTMEDIVTADFDYTQLDKSEHPVRIRLNSTVVNIQNQPDALVAVTYINPNNPQPIRIDAKKVIYAGHAAMASYIIPQMPDAQKAAAATNVRVPMIYSKIAVKNAHLFQKHHLNEIYTPDMPYCLLMLDPPVSMGDYHCAQTPDEPIVIHAVRIATTMIGDTARDKYRSGRWELFAQSETDLKDELMNYLRTIYAAGGENFDEIYIDSTINRWAHGYSYEQTGLWDTDESNETVANTICQSIGNIYISGSDSVCMPYLQYAVDEGYRAVQEALA